MASSPAGKLISTSATAGASAAEIANLALAAANARIAWTSDGCAAFVWGIANLAGLPFFDLGNRTFNNDPRSPRGDIGYALPHSWNPNAPDDGWNVVSTERSVAALSNILKAGDVVRVYAAGNSGEATFLNGKAVGHSFVVVSVSNGDVQVADNWSGGVISVHSLSVIAKSFAPGGTFGSVYVSRIDDGWVASHVPSTVQGLGYGDWSGFIDSTPPTLLSSTPADDATKVALNANIVLTFSEKIVAGAGAIEIWNKSGKLFESLNVTDSRVQISGSTVTIDPKGLLASGSDYYLQLKSGVIKDAAGNSFAGISSKTQLNFSTVTDNTAPKVVSTSPADDSLKVSTSADIVLKFNEDVIPGSGKIEIYKADGKLFESIDVNGGRVEFSGATVTIDPKGKFDPNSGYYVKFGSGVIEDLAGNDFRGLAKNDLNFTTSNSKSSQVQGMEAVASVEGHGGQPNPGAISVAPDSIAAAIFGETPAGSFASVSPGAFSEASDSGTLHLSTLIDPISQAWHLP